MAILWYYVLYYIFFYSLYTMRIWLLNALVKSYHTHVIDHVICPNFIMVWIL